MSTRINVNIGDGGLLDRNAQQQAAARQANQQRATAEKAAAEGQRQLEEERIRKGLDPDTGERLPSAGSSSRIQRIDQEPAANRRGGFPNILLVPSSDYTDYGGTYTGLRSRAKNILAPIFSRYEYAAEEEPTAGLYLPNGGPNGFGALELNPPEFPECPIETIEFFRKTAQDGTFEGITQNITYRDAYPDNLPPRNFSTYLVYAAFPATYDTVPQWMGPAGGFDPDFSAPPYGVVSSDGGLVYPTAKFTLNQIGSFTHEFMMRGAAFGYEESTSFALNAGEFSADRGMSISISASGVFFSVEIVDLPTTEFFYDTLGSPGNIPVRDIIYKKRFRISARFNAPALYFETVPPPGFNPDSPILFGQGYNLEPVNPPAPTKVGLEYPTLESFADTLGGEGWTHVAICRSKVGEFGKWRFFINGTQVGSTPFTGSDDVFVDRAEWRDSYGTQPPSASFRLSSGINFVAANPPLNPAISGYRFTPKALYSENFTPPTAIGGFR